VPNFDLILRGGKFCGFYGTYFDGTIEAKEAVADFLVLISTEGWEKEWREVGISTKKSVIYIVDEALLQHKHQKIHYLK
jgi:hypothetical protein